MGSKAAIYSEVVDLVLSVENYEKKIDQAISGLLEVGKTAKALKQEFDNVFNNNNTYFKMVEGADELIRKQNELVRQQRELNKLMTERKNVATFGESAGLDIDARNRAQGRTFGAGVDYFSNKAALAQVKDFELADMNKYYKELEALGSNNVVNEARIAELRAAKARDEANDMAAIKEREFQEYKANLRKLEIEGQNHLVNEARIAELRAAKARDEANDMAAIKEREFQQLKEQYRKQQDLDASYALNAEQNAKNLAAARQRADKIKTAKNDEEARHQRKLMDFDVKRSADLDTFFSKQAQGINFLAQAEKAHVVAQRADMQQVLALENQRLQIVKQRMAAEDAAMRKTAGGRVGSFASGARVGAALDMAAGAGFAIGGTNIGGALYMMERLSYATGVGQKNLGELAEKFGLVQLKGDGAAASMKAFGDNIILWGGTLAAALAPVAAMLAGNKLDNALASMSTLLADTTVKGEKFASMMNDTAAAAARVSESFGLGLVDTVNGFKTALSTGIESNQLEEFGRIAATTAKGLGASFDDAVGIITTFKDAYGLGMQGMATSTDVLFNAINVGKFQVDDLRNNIGRIVTASAEAGVNMHDMAAGLATLTRVGLSTSQAITSLNRFIQNIVSPTDQAKKKFDELGLATGHAAFKTQTLMQYLTQLKAAVGGNADLMGELFTTEQGRRGAIGLTTNLGLTSDIRSAMNDVGTATVAANRAMDTFSQNFGKIFSAVWDVVQLIGRDLLQVANDVFFPGGPLGADNLSGLKNILEVIGMVVKEVGVILITAFGAAYHVVKALGQSIAGVTEMLTGDFRKGLETFRSGIIDAGVGTWSGLKALITTLDSSATRMQSNLAGIAAGANDVATALTATKEAAKPLFGEEALSAVTKFGEHTKTVFAKIADEIRKAAFEAAKLEFSMANPKKPPTAAPGPMSEGEKEFLGKLSIGAGIRAEASTSSFSGNRHFEKSVKARILAAGGVDPDDPDVQAQLEAWRKGTLEKQARLGEDAAKAYNEAYKKQREQALREAGFGAELDTEANKGGKKLGVATAGRIKDLMDMLDALKTGKAGKKSVTSTGHFFTKDETGTATGTSIIDMSPEEQLRQARAVYDGLSVYYKLYKGTMLEADRKFYENSLRVAKDGIEELTKKQAEATAKKYKAEYDAALRVYNAKMAAFDKEGKRLDELLNKYQDFMLTLRERRDARDEARRGPEYAYRKEREKAESGIDDLRKIVDPAKALKAAEDLLKTIDKMMAKGEAAGFGVRAGRTADDMESQIEAIMKARGIDTSKAKAANENNIENAIAAFKRDMADNPVAQAALAQAMVVMKEAVAEATKHGIGIAGDLKQDIDISGININLPIAEFKSTIASTFKVLITDWMRNNKNGNEDKPGDNIAPTGSPFDSGYTGTTSGTAGF